MAERDHIGGLAKGLAVIEAFGPERPRLTIAEAAAATGLDRATARRCLLTLAHLGYLTWDGKFFAPAPRILRLGQGFLSATPLPRLVQPFLERLQEETGETSAVSVRDGDEIAYVARAASRRVMSINLAPGSRLPMHCSSMGRVLLAALPEREAREVLERSPRRAFSAHTRTEVPEIMEELDRVRAQGFAMIDQELEAGLITVALPIRGADGAVLAAINLASQLYRTSRERLIGHYLPQLRATRDRIEAALA